MAKLVDVASRSHARPMARTKSECPMWHVQDPRSTSKMDVLNSESDIGLGTSCELKRHWRTRAGRRGHCHFVFTRHEHEGWNFTGAGSFLWRGECQMRPALRGCEVLDWNVTKRHEVPLWGKPRTNESDLNGVGRSCGSLGRRERFDHGARRLRTVDAGRLGARECPHDRQDQGQGAGNWHVAEYMRRHCPPPTARAARGLGLSTGDCRQLPRFR